MTTSYNVAYRFLQLGDSESIGISPMKLLKLTYIAHGFNLGIYGEPLIGDPIEAWKYGPVIVSLYEKIKFFRLSAVPQFALDSYAEGELDQRDIAIIDHVWKWYKNQSAVALSAKTHHKGTPWDQAIANNQRLITEDAIRSYYKTLIQPQ